MIIRQFTIADLEQCLRDNSLWQGDVIPITKHRAFSQIHNPRAEKSDVALLVAYDGERIVGYLGILPDKIFVGDQTHRIGWLTAWWADPNPKYAALGLMLLAKALKAWNDNIGVSGFAPSARKFYDASKKFVTTKEPTGILGLLRCNLHDLVPRMRPRLKPLKPLLWIIDAVASPFVEVRLRRWARRQSEVTFKCVDEIDEETQRFIERSQKKELTHRGAVELTWIGKYLWVFMAPSAVTDAARYHFSSVAQRFIFFNIQVRDANGRLIGFVLLNLHDDRLSVPYCYCAAEDADQVARAVARQAIALKAGTLTVFNLDLRRGLVNIRFPFLYQRAIKRPWIISAKFKDVDFTPYTMQDGDGDCAFT